jgi:hypothetical protein
VPFFTTAFLNYTTNYGTAPKNVILSILLRLLAGGAFQRGPWHLGRWSYEIVAVGMVALFSSGYWVSARKWFKGPKVQGRAEELAATEHELERVGI